MSKLGHRAPAKALAIISFSSLYFVALGDWEEIHGWIYQESSVISFGNRKR